MFMWKTTGRKTTKSITWSIERRICLEFLFRGFLHQANEFLHFSTFTLSDFYTLKIHFYSQIFRFTTCRKCKKLKDCLSYQSLRSMVKNSLLRIVQIRKKFRQFIFPREFESSSRVKPIALFWIEPFNANK